MKIRIVFLEEPGSVSPPRGEMTIEVGQLPIIIGSDASAQVRINNTSVEPRHATLRLDRTDPTKLVIMDVSRNGILINGVEEGGRTEIKFGDVIKIGDISFKIEEPLEEDAGDAVEHEEEVVSDPAAATFRSSPAPAPPRVTPPDPRATAKTMFPDHDAWNLPDPPAAPRPDPIPDPFGAISSSATPAASGSSSSVWVDAPTMVTRRVILDPPRATPTKPVPVTPPPAATSAPAPTPTPTPTPAVTTRSGPSGTRMGMAAPAAPAATPTAKVMPVTAAPRRSIPARIGGWLWKRLQISWWYTDGVSVVLYLVAGFFALLLVKCGSCIMDDQKVHERSSQLVGNTSQPAPMEEPTPPPTPKRVCKPSCDVQSDCRAVKRWEFPILTSDHLGQGRYDCSMLSAIPVNPQGLEDRSGCLWCEVK